MYLNTVFKYNVFKYCPALLASRRMNVSEYNTVELTVFHCNKIKQV